MYVQAQVNFAESQNGRTWKEPLEIIWSNALLKLVSLEQLAQDCIQVFFVSLWYSLMSEYFSKCLDYWWNEAVQSVKETRAYVTWCGNKSVSFCSVVLPRTGLVLVCVVEPRQEPHQCRPEDSRVKLKTDKTNPSPPSCSLVVLLHEKPQLEECGWVSVAEGKKIAVIAERK